MPKRERYLWVCTNRRPDGHPKSSCAERGAEGLLVKLKTSVAEAGLHRKVRVMSGSCQDLCWVGVTVAVMPDNEFLGHMTEADVPALVEALRTGESLAAHPVLKDRLVKPEQYDEPPVQLGRKPG